MASHSGSPPFPSHSGGLGQPFFSLSSPLAAPSNAFGNTAPSEFLQAKRKVEEHQCNDAEASNGKCGCGIAHTPNPEDPPIVEDITSNISHTVNADSSLQASLAEHEKLGEPAKPGTWSLHELVEYNKAFVSGEKYKKYLTDRYPFKRVVVVACMDTRLTELLPQALDLHNGDAKIIKVAGAMVAHPFGSVMRSILVAVYALGAEHIIIVGHHDCGMTGLDGDKILSQARARGVSDTTFRTLSAAGLNLNGWLTGFESVQKSVLHSVETVRNHPLLAGTKPSLTVHGMVICPTTGKLDILTPMEQAGAPENA